MLLGGCADAPERIGEWIGDVLDQVVILQAGSETEIRVLEALGRSEKDSGWLLVPVERELPFGADDPASAEVTAVFDKVEKRSADRFEARSAVAFELQASGKLEAAEKLYRSLDAMLGAEASPRHAFLLVTLSGLAESQHKLDEAAAWLDRALAIAPGHLGALRARARLAHDANEEAVAAAMLHRIIRSSESEFKRSEMLADICKESLAAACRALKEAAELKPGDHSLLERLQAVHEAAGDWEKAVGVSVRIAEATEDRRERAKALVRAARLCSERTGKTARAVALFEAAIEDDPTVPGAFEAVEAELVKAEDHAGVAAAYRRQLDRLSGDEGRPQSIEILRKLAALQWEKLKDAKSATAALRHLIDLDPDDAMPRVALAELLAHTGDRTRAIEVVETAISKLPRRVESYRTLYSLCRASNQADQAYNACAAMVAMGDADIDEQLVHAQHSPDGLLSMQAGFDEAVWKALAPEGHQPLVGAAAAVLEPAALQIWLEEHPQARAQVFPESARQNPVKTTVMAVRCVVWCSKLLGVAEPAIYAQPSDHRISIAWVPTAEPKVVLGRQLLSGRSVPELAFIAAHHMAYARPGHRLVMYYADIAEMEALLRAAIALVRPDLAAGSALDARSQTLRSLLDKHLDPVLRPKMADIVEGLIRSGAPLDLPKWVRGIEEVACRAALVLTGDMSVAAGALTLSTAPVGGASARDRTNALLPFSVSRLHSSLRARLGIAVTE